MSVLSAEEEERKKAIFQAMSARSRKRILDQGYDQWDPFQAPKDPLDIRDLQKKEIARSLMKRFLQTRPAEETNQAYCRGAWEICMGILGGAERARGMSDFCCWYRERMKNGEL